MKRAPKNRPGSWERSTGEQRGGGWRRERREEDSRSSWRCRCEDGGRPAGPGQAVRRTRGGATAPVRIRSNPGVYWDGMFGPSAPVISAVTHLQTVCSRSVNGGLECPTGPPTCPYRCIIHCNDRAGRSRGLHVDHGSSTARRCANFNGCAILPWRRCSFRLSPLLERWEGLG